MTITVHSILQMKSNNQIQPNYVVTFHYPSDPEMDDAAYLYVLESAAQKRLKTEYESLLTLYNQQYNEYIIDSHYEENYAHITLDHDDADEIIRLVEIRIFPIYQ